MHPAKVSRIRLQQLTDLPNIGAAGAADLRLLGIDHPEDLAGRDAYQMYDELCAITGKRHDPCVIDVFLSVTDFVAGNPPHPWWHYTAQRKAVLSGVKK